MADENRRYRRGRFLTKLVPHQTGRRTKLRPMAQAHT